MTSQPEQHSEEPGLDYQLTVLRMMLQQLPPSISKILESQLDEVAKAARDRNVILFQFIIEQLQDIRVSVKYMEFDLDATKREKEELEKRLKNAGLL